MREKVCPVFSQAALVDFKTYFVADALINDQLPRCSGLLFATRKTEEMLCLMHTGGEKREMNSCKYTEDDWNIFTADSVRGFITPV